MIKVATSVTPTIVLQVKRKKGEENVYGMHHELEQKVLTTKSS